MSDDSGTAPPGTGDLNDDLLATDIWSDGAVAAAGIPFFDVPLVTIGGGLGSFALVDTLRIAGVPTDQIAVLTTLTKPWATYEYLARNSQIPGHERLRSDAASTMDNIWGFPSYAVRESLNAPDMAGKLRPLWNVLSEPLFTDFYTPRAGDVYSSVEKEAARIGWSRMLHRGMVRMVRRRQGGGYFSVLTPPKGTSATRRVAYRSRWVHVAVGYPGVKFLPDLQAYREKHRDFSRVVNAYEPHDHVYEELRARGGTVVVRGSGIVGSRILQRLIDDRENHGADTTIYHLFRNYIRGPEGEKATFRRDGGRGFAYQAFNFPKAAWGGQIKDEFEALDGPERAKLLGRLGGTNTPKRRSWQTQLDRGLSEGFYRQTIGSVSSVVPGPDQTILTTLVGDDGRTYSVDANFVIDATGLESDISEHRLLADLLEHGGASRNPYGRLEVDPDFLVAGTQAEPGRMYASGSATLGGHYAGVDSFLGLQYAALRIADDLAVQGFGARIGVGRSISQWWRWARNREVDQ
jgi:hypothetical protein